MRSRSALDPARCQRGLGRDRTGDNFRDLGLARNFRLARGGVTAAMPTNIPKVMQCFLTSAENSNRNTHSINPLRSSGFANAERM